MTHGSRTRDLRNQQVKQRRGWGFSGVLCGTRRSVSADGAGILSSMGRRSQLDDTSAGARAVQQALYASMTPAEKLQRMSELTLAASRLALAGLAARHPRESRQQLFLRLARLRLGADLVDRVYGASDGA